MKILSLLALLLICSGCSTQRLVESTLSVATKCAQIEFDSPAYAQQLRKQFDTLAACSIRQDKSPRDAIAGISAALDALGDLKPIQEPLAGQGISYVPHDFASCRKKWDEAKDRISRLAAAISFDLIRDRLPEIQEKLSGINGELRADIGAMCRVRKQCATNLARYFNARMVKDDKLMQAAQQLFELSRDLKESLEEAMKLDAESLRASVEDLGTACKLDLEVAERGLRAPRRQIERILTEEREKLKARIDAIIHALDAVEGSVKDLKASLSSAQAALDVAFGLVLERKDFLQSIFHAHLYKSVAGSLVETIDRNLDPAEKSLDRLDDRLFGLLSLFRLLTEDELRKGFEDAFRNTTSRLFRDERNDQYLRLSLARAACTRINESERIPGSAGYVKPLILGAVVTGLTPEEIREADHFPPKLGWVSTLCESSASPRIAQETGRTLVQIMPRFCESLAERAHPGDPTMTCTKADGIYVVEIAAPFADGASTDVSTARRLVSIADLAAAGKVRLDAGVRSYADLVDGKGTQPRRITFAESEDSFKQRKAGKLNTWKTIEGAVRIQGGGEYSGGENSLCGEVAKRPSAVSRKGEAGYFLKLYPCRLGRARSPEVGATYDLKGLSELPVEARLHLTLAGPDAQGEGVLSYLRAAWAADLMAGRAESFISISEIVALGAAHAVPYPGVNNRRMLIEFSLQGHRN